MSIIDIDKSIVDIDISIVDINISVTDIDISVVDIDICIVDSHVGELIEIKKIGKRGNGRKKRKKIIIIITKIKVGRLFLAFWQYFPKNVAYN